MKFETSLSIDDTILCVNLYYVKTFIYLLVYYLTFFFVFANTSLTLSFKTFILLTIQRCGIWYDINIPKSLLFTLFTIYIVPMYHLWFVIFKNVKSAMNCLTKWQRHNNGVIRSGVDCEHIYGAIFFMWTLDSILYSLLIVSCLFPSANKSTLLKGMIEFGYRLVTNVVRFAFPSSSSEKYMNLINNTSNNLFVRCKN